MTANWYVVARNNQKIGPLTLAQLQARAATGQLRVTDRVWQEGTPKWVAAGSVKGVFPVAPLSPAVQKATGHGAARRLLGSLKHLGKRLAQEGRETLAATWGQTARLVNYTTALWRKRRLKRSAFNAQLAVGEHLLASGLGDQHVRSKIASLDEQIRVAKAANRSTDSMQAERRTLLVQLAVPAIAEKHSEFKDAQATLREHEARISALRASLLPRGPWEWRRVAAGYGLVVCAVVGLVVLLSRSASEGRLDMTDSVIRPTTVAEDDIDRALAAMEDLAQAQRDLDDWMKAAVRNAGLFSWNEVLQAIGSRLEESQRDGQRCALDSGRFLAIEGTNALDVFFPASPEGLLAGRAFLSSRLFTTIERVRLIQLLEARKNAERVIGRFKVSLTATGEDDLWLPRFWIRMNIEPADATGKIVLHARQPPVVYPSDEFFTVSKHRAANTYVRGLLASNLPKTELHDKIRMLNLLADGIGLTAEETLVRLKRVVASAERKGLEPVSGVSAFTSSLAFSGALHEQSLESWRKGK